MTVYSPVHCPRAKMLIAVAIAAVLVLPGSATAQPQYERGGSPDSSTASFQHALTCTITPYIPQRTGGNIYGYGKRTCTDSPDTANLTIQLQRYSNGSWVNYGAAYTTNSTNTYIYAYDVNGCYNRGQTVSYRTMITNTAFHGNWFTNEKPSATFTTSCPQ